MNDTNDVMTAIDKYIQETYEFHETQEFDDFVKNEIYPNISKNKQTSNYMPLELDEIKINHVEPLAHSSYICEEINMYNELSHIREVLCEVERDIQEITILDTDQTTSGKYEYKTNTDHSECPICMEHIGIKNYIVPPCGHRLCINCFVTNIAVNSNSQCGKKCSLCREFIIS